MKCLDTYALIEIHNCNPHFQKLLNEGVINPDILMAEFYGILYKRFNLQTAEYWYQKLHALCTPVPITIFLKAVKYRADHKKENLSFFDCVGYMYAHEHKIPFVTGDHAFQHRNGVEFIV